MEVQAMSKLPRLDTSITFSDSNLEGCQHPHDDPLVIRAVVANKTVHRVLVDNGSSADIIFASVFHKMGIGKEKLELVSTYLRGFSGEKVLPLGSMQLVLTLGDPPCQATTTVRFLVVDAPSAYNMLLGRPSLNAIKVIPSAYHMMIKFPTISGVGMVRGDQRVARECYSASLKQTTIDNIYLDELDMRNEVHTRPEPSEELEPVSLDDDPEHLAYICSKLAEDLRSPLTRFLKQNKNVFAWKQVDMGGIDPTVITHRLNVMVLIRSELVSELSETVMVLIRSDLLAHLPTQFSGISSFEIPFATISVFIKIPCHALIPNSRLPSAYENALCHFQNHLHNMSICIFSINYNYTHVIQHIKHHPI